MAASFLSHLSCQIPLLLCIRTIIKQIEDNLNPSNLVHSIILLTREGSQAGSVNSRDILKIGMIPVWVEYKKKEFINLS